jgi:hypothetical protein
MKIQNNFNRSVSFLLIVLVLILGTLQTYSQTKIIKPKIAGVKVSIIVSGKNRTYYQLSNDKVIMLTVKGPGKLKIITRGQFNSSNNNYWNYSLFYRIDGTEKIKTDFNRVNRDANSEFKDKSLGIPAEGENILIDLARGEHTIELWSESASPKIHARFIFTETKEKKINWIPLSPLFPNEPVSLVTNEDVVSYYRFSSKKPLKIRITGPTTLRILNRLETSYKMKGVINYRIQVKEDIIVKNTYMLNCIGSDVTSYKKPCDKIPGKANEIVINVPGGTHLYEIIPLDKDKNTVLARILFPKQDVKLEE